MIPLLEGRKLELKDILYDECGKALSCQERALFFSSKNSNQTSRPGTKSPIEENPTTSGLLRAITNDYASAWEMLMLRLDEVTKEYEGLIFWFKFLKFLGIGIPDRDYKFTLESEGIVRDRFNDLLRVARNLPVSDDKDEVTTVLDDYTRTWQGLNNICQLFMEEISFLCKRIESLQGIMNVARGWGITFVLFLAGNYISSCAASKSKVNNGSVTFNAPVKFVIQGESSKDQSGNEDLKSQIDNLSKVISMAGTNIASINSTIYNLNTNFQNPLFIEVSDTSVQKIANAVTSNGSNTPTDTSALMEKIVTANEAYTSNSATISTNLIAIKDSLFDIRGVLETNSAATSTNLIKINQNLSAITNSVNRVKTAIDDKKIPPIDIRSLPEKRARVLGIPVITTEPAPTPQ